MAGTASFDHVLRRAWEEVHAYSAKLSLAHLVRRSRQEQHYLTMCCVWPRNRCMHTQHSYMWLSIQQVGLCRMRHCASTLYGC